MCESGDYLIAKALPVLRGGCTYIRYGMTDMMKSKSEAGFGASELQ